MDSYIVLQIAHHYFDEIKVYVERSLCQNKEFLPFLLGNNESEMYQINNKTRPAHIILVLVVIVMS